VWVVKETATQGAVQMNSKVLDQDVTVYAANMIYAQGFKLNEEQRSILTAKADYLRELTGTTEKFTVGVEVRDIYEPHPVIGSLSYQLWLAKGTHMNVTISENVTSGDAFPPLTLHDSCDRCGSSADGTRIAVAAVRVTKGPRDMTFCGHHYNELEAVLFGAGWSLFEDIRSKAAVKPGASAWDN
jgi:hypothetical protein